MRTRKKSWGWLRLGVSFTILALTLAACGDTNKPVPAAVGTAPTLNQPTATNPGIVTYVVPTAAPGTAEVGTLFTIPGRTPVPGNNLPTVLPPAVLSQTQTASARITYVAPQMYITVSGPTPTSNYAATVEIKGRLLQVSPTGVLVEEDKPYKIVDRISVNFTARTRLLEEKDGSRLPVPSSFLKIGQKVQLILEPQIATSYPPQVQALELIVQSQS